MKIEIQVMVINSLTNILLTLLKILGGLFFNSQLLLADGIHSGSDLMTDLFSIIGLKLSGRPADEAHPFGHSKLEYAAGLTMSMFIFFITYNLTRDVISEWNQLNTFLEAIVVVIAIITLIVKYCLSVFVLKKAKVLNSLTLENSGIESRTDALSTFVVLLGLVLKSIGLHYNIQLLIYSEKIATVFVIMMLLKAAGTIYFNALVGIAGTPAEKRISENYLESIKSWDPTIRIDSFLVIKEGTEYAVAATLAFDPSTELKDVYFTLKQIKEQLLKESGICKVSMEFVIS